jgi:hypothetical protein
VSRVSQKVAPGPEILNIGGRRMEGSEVLCRAEESATVPAGQEVQLQFLKFLRRRAPPQGELVKQRFDSGNTYKLVWTRDVAHFVGPLGRRRTLSGGRYCISTFPAFQQKAGSGESRRAPHVWRAGEDPPRAERAPLLYGAAPLEDVDENA